MRFKFQNKKISGILTVVPKNEVAFEDEAAKFNSTPKQMKRLKEVTKFGNAASATIPTNICLNLIPDILQKSFNVCMAGFGTGLAVGVMTMKFGSLNICEIVEY